MRKSELLIIVLLSLFLGFVLPGKVFAAETIQNFDVNLVAQQNGNMQVSEVINYDFGAVAKHGIYRMLPLVTQVGNDLQRVISVDVNSVQRDGQQEPFDTNSSNQTLQVKIGDPNQTLTGMHTYTIDYSVENGIGSNYSDHDEIYWNVTGNEWNVPIQEASIVMKTDFAVLPRKTICYTGALGSRVSNCVVSDIPDGKKVTTTGMLLANEGLSAVSSFPVGTFPKSQLQSLQQTRVDILNPQILIPVYVILNLIVAPGLLFWYIKYKRKKNLGPVVVNFDLPKDAKGKRITPAEAGTIDNAKLDKDDVTATIFDLAIRKYLHIEQVEKKKSLLEFVEKQDYRLVKLKGFEDLNPFEKRLTKAIFANEKTVLLSDVKIVFADYDDLEADNFTSLMHRRFYTKDPQAQMGTFLGMGIFALITLNLLLGVVLILLSRKLNGRTPLGDEMDWRIDGLKLFLKNMNRYYKWQAEKAYVVEQMIPYAMALGYIDTYMKQVKILQPDYQPHWYVGQTAFWVFAPGFHDSFNSAVVTTALSSSSGFSGGGFSGGGGGGGGGGSW